MKNFLSKAAITVLVIVGGVLIENHTSRNSTSFGLLIWLVAISLFARSMPAAPTIPMFTQSGLLSWSGKKKWPLSRILGVSLSLLVLVGLLGFWIQNDNWFLVLFALIAIGGLFLLLENHSPAFWSQANTSEKTPWIEKPYLPETLILLVGSFFMFIPFHKPLPYFLSGGGDCDYSFIYTLCFTGNNGSQWTTPYTDIWSVGFCALPFYLGGLFLNLVGISILKQIIMFSLLCLVGLIFFYKFLCFYVKKESALIATLLFSSSHWLLYYSRQTYVGMGFIIPLTAASLYYFARSIELGKARDYAIFGVLLGCDLMIHLALRLYFIYFIVILVMAWFSSERNKIRGQEKFWLFGFGISCLLYLPMFLYFHEHKNTATSFINPDLFKMYGVWHGEGPFPWGYIFSDLKMFTVRNNCWEFLWWPFLSPWESVFFLVGLAWCLWRCYKPAFFLLFAGFINGIVPDIITGGTNNPHRAYVALLFVYLFAGIGIDRLERLVIPAQGSIYRWLKYAFLFLFLIFSLGWHYYISFDQLPRLRLIWINENMDTYGHITEKHLTGWDTYDVGVGEAIYHPESGFYYSKEQLGNRISARLKDIPLPLKHVPTKGALIILNDEYGRAFQDWLHYYYPEVPEQVTYNSYGEVQFRYWEISADQIQKALQENKPMDSGLILRAYGPHGNLVNQWRVPAITSNVINDEWFFQDPATGQSSLPWKKIGYFTITGYMNTDGKPIALETNGKVSGTFDGKPVGLNGLKAPARKELVSSKGWAQVNLSYTPRETLFNLNLQQHNLTGWDLIPADELSTAVRH